MLRLLIFENFVYTLPFIPNTKGGGVFIALYAEYQIFAQSRGGVFGMKGTVLNIIFFSRFDFTLKSIRHES